MIVRRNLLVGDAGTLATEEEAVNGRFRGKEAGDRSLAIGGRQSVAASLCLILLPVDDKGEERH